MEFQIWSEGYVENGGRSVARLHGTQEAETFKEACDIFFKDNEYYAHDTYWGCRLFDNETDARKSFG